MLISLFKTFHFYFKIGSHYIAQPDLELVILLL